MVHSSGSSAEWPLGDPSVEGSFVVDHADSLNGSSLSLSAKVASLHPENSDGNRSRAPTRREEEQEDEELESSQDMVPKLIGSFHACLARGPSCRWSSAGALTAVCAWQVCLERPGRTACSRA